MTAPYSTSRLRTAVCLALALGLAVCARLLFLQVIEGDHFASLARGQASERIEVDLPRATLLDRNGLPLAVGIPCPSLYTLDPRSVQEPKALASAVSALSGKSARRILHSLRTRKRFTWLARKLPFESYGRARALGDRFEGVKVMEEAGRYYPNGPLAANLIGCMGMDGGLSGLEHQWDSQLRGGKRRFLIMRDAMPTRLIPLEVVEKVGEAPRSVRLTVDIPIQDRCEEVLKGIVRNLNAKDGVILVLDCRNGDLLAMAVAPTFDPNAPESYPASSWRNRAVTDSYEPGSTMKVITLAAALDSGRLKPGDTIPIGNGTLTVGPHTIHDDEPPLKPVYTLEEVLAHSSNVGAAKVGMAVGADTLYHYMYLFGFGHISPLAMTGEVPGRLRPVREWTQLSLPSLSFGQELRATPLQLALAFSVVASGGYRVVPKLLVDAPRPPFDRILKASTARILTDMMESVVKFGTGRAASIPGVAVAGKTGTAQKIGIRSADGKPLYIAYFVGFAPADDPRVVVLVMVDEPKERIYGGSVSAPAFADVTSFALRRLASPDRPSKWDLAFLEGKP